MPVYSVGLLTINNNYYTLNYLLSDSPKVHSEYSKLAPLSTSACRLYNNYVKDTQGHR